MHLATLPEATVMDTAHCGHKTFPSSKKALLTGCPKPPVFSSLWLWSEVTEAAASLGWGHAESAAYWESKSREWVVWKCPQSPTQDWVQGSLELWNLALPEGGTTWSYHPSPLASQVAQVGKESACQFRSCRSCIFNPCIEKIPWRRKWQPTPVFLPGKSLWTEEPGRLQPRGSQSQTWLKWQKVKVKSLSSVWLFATPWTVAYQAPPSMGFSRQEYWSGLPFPSPGDLPDPGIEPGSPTSRADVLTSEPPGKPLKWQRTLANYLSEFWLAAGTWFCLPPNPFHECFRVWGCSHLTWSSDLDPCPKTPHLSDHPVSNPPLIDSCCL